MEKEQRSRLQKATQDARKLLEEEFRSQLLQTYDIDVEKVRWAEEPGAHLQAEQRLIREKLVAWIEHKAAQINDRKEALLLALREMAFTALNRFVALKLMEARELVRLCVSGGLESAGFLEFTAMAQGLLADQESSYQLYLETIFEDVSRELRALFDPRDPASLLWPKRAALLELLEILNRPELTELWAEDETLGWVYQYFNGDDVKQMRDAANGGAPRNSRELAVRNQFFTPRYVVEFLTDNTLGRIWYEMRQGNTKLKDRCRYLVRRPNEVWLQPGEEPPAQADANEALSQEKLLRQPVYIPHRPLKDPREIRMLDPACGSMHFGLYAFDLYLEIYAEAWEIAQGSDEQSTQEEAFSPFVAYAAGFADKPAFLREVPRLILQHNIHGIDIDPRATQIARLTLWLRAQRAWLAQQLNVSRRPSIIRSNVVCAEPMPGERELLADFVDQQFPDAERGLVQQLLQTIFDKMQLAGEAGSLLRIEDEIRGAIEDAQGEWQKLAVHQRNLFSASELESLGQLATSLETDLQSLTKDFWIDIEKRIYAALSDYSEYTDSAFVFRRKLFAEDAAGGFAFIDICRKSYDAILMNPPFGEPSTQSIPLLKNAYPISKVNIYACFCERGGALLAPRGLLGAITSRSGFFQSSLTSWREEFILSQMRPVAFADLGAGVLDAATVETACYVLQQTDASFLALFIDALRSEDKSSTMLEGIRNIASAIPTNLVHAVPIEYFSIIPGSPLAYSVSARVRESFIKSPAPEETGKAIRIGLSTKNDERFVRVAWEVPIDAVGRQKLWSRYANGGQTQPFFDNYPLVVKSSHDFQELRSYLDQKFPYLNGNLSFILHQENSYNEPAIVWPLRALRFSPHVLPAGYVFSARSYAMLFDDAADIIPSLSFLASSAVHNLLRLQLGETGRPEYVTSAVRKLPFPDLSPWREELASVASRGLTYMMSRCSLSETSPIFCYVDTQSAFECIQKVESEADVLGLQLYAFDESDLKSCGDPVVSFSSCIPDQPEAVDRSPSLWLGFSFGRWDIRFATGEQVVPELPDPFAPFPACPPCQLQNDQGLPARPADVPAAYPIHIPWDGILVDDPNHPLDLERRVREVIEIICNDKDNSPTPDVIESAACETVGAQSLREYFHKPSSFFADHLKRYSKSRRQAPIYWQLSAGSGSYAAWLYYHRFTQDTLYRLLRDFVEPRIQQAEREQFEMESQGALSGDAATRLQEAQTLLQDLRIFKSELDLVAPLWNPNLNDGVIINHAILWRITPYTPWQKKCKECWDKLVKGDYDWAHLAFHLWPGRVIPKCTTDRSLAIAHGLEERLWQETNNGNWLPRQLSEADLQALIAEHSNPAVKSALERFLAAPPPVAPTRTRASRSTRASGSSRPRRARGSAAMVDAEATRQVLLALTAAPSDGLAKTQIADLIGVEANALTAVIKQLKESGQIDQLGERRGARYVLSAQGRARLEQEEQP